MTLLIVYLFIALGFSFLCSLLESALLSLPRSHVAVMRERGDPMGGRLEAMKDDVDRPLAAILTLNTFAHTLGAAGVGAQATLLWGEAWLGAVSVVVTLLILVFSEIIPKTIGAVRAKALAGFTARTVHVMIVLLWPVVAVCNWTSKLLSGRDQAVPRISREEVHGVARLAHEEGAIDRNEARIMRNLIALRHTTAKEVMTPRIVVSTVRRDQTVGEVMEGEPPRFARLPVIGESVDDVRGLVVRYELVTALGEGRADEPLEALVRPVHAVTELATLPAVLEEMLERREHLFVVVDEHGGTAGIVTLEDVLETLLGIEIVDETDPVEDMQALARQLVRAGRRKGDGPA